MPTTSTTYGAEYGTSEQYNGILGFINGAGYTQDQQDKISAALFEAHRVEVAERLPEGVSWQPATSEFLYEVSNDQRGKVLPTVEEMAELFADAWTAVEARYQDIEAETLGVV